MNRRALPQSLNLKMRVKKPKLSHLLKSSHLLLSVKTLIMRMHLAQKRRAKRTVMQRLTVKVTHQNQNLQGPIQITVTKRSVVL